jgi:hypothetical protein
MWRRRGRTCVSGLLLTRVASDIPLASSPECAADDEAVGRALKLLPRQPERVVVFDVERTTPLLISIQTRPVAIRTTGGPDSGALA